MEYDCELCGEQFKAPPSAERRFCSRECSDKWKSEAYQGENHPRWVERDTAVCETCGEAFEERAGNPNRFCSRECQAKAQSEEFAGENCYLYGVTGKDHPKYTGHEDYYGANWEQQREKALARDGHKCVVCGVGSDEHRKRHGCDLHVHHIQPLATYETPEAANQLDNLTTLCRPHHAKWEGIPIMPEVVCNEQ